MSRLDQLGSKSREVRCRLVGRWYNIGEDCNYFGNHRPARKLLWSILNENNRVCST